MGEWDKVVIENAFLIRWFFNALSCFNSWGHFLLVRSPLVDLGVVLGFGQLGVCLLLGETVTGPLEEVELVLNFFGRCPIGERCGEG